MVDSLVTVASVVGGFFVFPPCFIMQYLVSLFCSHLHLTRKRELVVMLLLSIGCLVTVNVLWLFLTVLWVGLKCVIEVFPDHTYLLFHYLNHLAKEGELIDLLFPAVVLLVRVSS